MPKTWVIIALMRLDFLSVNNYLNSASETIKSADKVDASFDQDGNEVFVFRKSYTEADETFKLKAIVKVTPDGKVILATYFKDTSK